MVSEEEDQTSRTMVRIWESCGGGIAGRRSGEWRRPVGDVMASPAKRRGTSVSGAQLRLRRESRLGVPKTSKTSGTSLHLWLSTERVHTRLGSCGAEATLTDEQCSGPALSMATCPSAPWHTTKPFAKMGKPAAISISIAREAQAIAPSRVINIVICEKETPAELPSSLPPPEINHSKRGTSAPRQRRFAETHDDAIAAVEAWGYKRLLPRKLEAGQAPVPAYPDDDFDTDCEPEADASRLHGLQTLTRLFVYLQYPRFLPSTTCARRAKAQMRLPTVQSARYELHYSFHYGPRADTELT